VAGNSVVLRAENGDINIAAKTREVRGKFDWKKEVTASKILSGTGKVSDDANAPSMLIQGKHVTVTASQLATQGDMTVLGKEGVSLETVTDTYVSDYHSKRNWCVLMCMSFLIFNNFSIFRYGKKKTSTTITTDVYSSTLTANGKITIASAEGEVKSTAAYISAAKVS